MIALLLMLSSFILHVASHNSNAIKPIAAQRPIPFGGCLTTSCIQGFLLVKLPFCMYFSSLFSHVISDTKHVMISYQWDVQKPMIQLKTQLQSQGYKVWMDVDEMGGSTLESMAKAVENASVVLVCVSQKYKESPNCRSGDYKSSVLDLGLWSERIAPWGRP